MLRKERKMRILMNFLLVNSKIKSNSLKEIFQILVLNKGILITHRAGLKKGKRKVNLKENLVFPKLIMITLVL